MIALFKDSDKSDSRAILKLEQNVRSMLRLGTNNADRRFYLSAFHHPLDGRWTFVLRLDDLASAGAKEHAPSPSLSHLGDDQIAGTRARGDKVQHLTASDCEVFRPVARQEGRRAIGGDHSCRANRCPDGKG